jgi:hypothetical protein
VVLGVVVAGDVVVVVGGEAVGVAQDLSTTRNHVSKDHPPLQGGSQGSAGAMPKGRAGTVRDTAGRPDPWVEEVARSAGEMREVAGRAAGAEDRAAGMAKPPQQLG